jgi:two-component sensor histidine kinase
MKANTALLLVLSGVSLRWSDRMRPWRASAWIAGLVALVALVTLSQDIFGWNLRIDESLFRDLSTAGTFAPGRMAPTTALCFLLLASSLVALAFGRWRWLAQPTAVVCALVALVAVVGYLYDVRVLYGVGPYTTMALHTALLLLVLSVGVLLADPVGPLTVVVLDDGLGASMARRLLPVVILMPIVLGWLRLRGQTLGLYGTEFGLSLMVVSSIMVLSAVLWFNARSLTRVENERRQADDALQALARSLEHRVEVQARELSQREQRLRTSLQEKEALLKESHHRVNKNLQVVSSLLRLQGRQLKDPEALRALRESEERVMSMALLHESLYRSDDLAHIDVAAHLETLTKALLRTHVGSRDRVTIDTDVDLPGLDIEKAVTVGLLVTELVANALKHAFPDDRIGTVWVRMTATKGTCLLTVKDNGVGVRDGGRIDQTPSLGFEIVDTLCHQLEGKYSFTYDGGTEFRLEFQVP